MKSKKQAQKDHAKKRFAERLGIKFSQYLNDMLLHMVHSGNAQLVAKQSNRVFVYEVVFTPREKDMFINEPTEITAHIVYDKMRKTIVTVGEPGTTFDGIV